MKAEIKTQVCKKCGLEKPLSEYYFRDDTQKHRRDCKDCMCSRSKKYYRANPEKVKAKNKIWKKANREKVQQYKYKWKKNNTKKTRAADIAWRKANAEKHRASVSAWAKNNPEKVRAYKAKRRAAKLQATPAWADLQKIQKIYLNCPPGHHIDHIFPLNSPIMCGLHVENNLQYLPAKENISKGNRISLEEQLNG
jgi:hypothetical protein